MATVSAVAPARWRRPFLVWLDGIERGWGIPVLICGFAGVWMLFLVIAYWNSSLHFDALETWSLGRSFAWGNAKHPPLMGWVARLWTSVFPTTDWSFQLLATTNAAAALWSVDLIARRFVRGDKRAVVLLLAMLLPAYQFHAQRFNANTVLLAIWPLAIYCFMRSFETLQVRWAVAAGAAAAIAMLGKYYSIFLIGSFAFAAIAHPLRQRYFRSSAPWVSAAAGLLVLTPHIYWLATTGAGPFKYALQAHGGLKFWPSVTWASMFLLGVAASLALPALAWVLIAETRLKRIPADIAAMDSALWLLFLICVATLALPAIVAVVLGTEMPSLWALQGLFLVAILFVCGARYPIERFYTVNLAVLVIAIGLIAVVVAAPIHAIYRNAYRGDDRVFYRLAALDLTRQWHAVSDVPLPGISGENALAFATAFYSPDHPMYRRPFEYEDSWRMPRVSTLDRGWAAMCFVEDAVCMNWMDKVSALGPRIIRSEFVARPRLWGRAGATARIVTLIVPPQNGPAPAAPGSSAQDFSASRRSR